MSHFTLCVVALLVVWITKWLYKWRNPSCSGTLPPGSMGWPLIGETIQIFKAQSSFRIHPFIENKMKKYGPICKTSLLGWPVIIPTDPQLMNFIMQQDGISAEIWFPSSFIKLFGKQMIPNSTGFLRKYHKNLVMDHFGPEKQKHKLLCEIEELVLKHLDNWSKHESVEVHEVTTKMAFDIGSMKLMSYDPSKYSDDLQGKYDNMVKGLFSFPLDVPGTFFHDCVKDRKKAVRIIGDAVKERLYSSKKHGDFLDDMIDEMKKEEPLFTIESAAYSIFAILFASFETVSLVLTMAIKFISEHPSVMNELKAEHHEIIKKRENANSPLIWQEYKSMTFTTHVIDETLRLGRVPTFIFKRAVRDIHIHGYTIPTGWLIMLYPPIIHLNPEKYEEPTTFNPWRWKGQASNIASKNFMAFGGGPRVCAGAEFAKLQISVVLHYLVTKYRWETSKGGEVLLTPATTFPNGLHIKVTQN